MFQNYSLLELQLCSGRVFETHPNFTGELHRAVVEQHREDFRFNWQRRDDLGELHAFWDGIQHAREQGRARRRVQFRRFREPVM